VICLKYPRAGTMFIGGNVTRMKAIRKLYPMCGVCILFIFYLSWSNSLSAMGDDIVYKATLRTGQFPRKIWQTWRVDPLTFEEKYLSIAHTWIEKNPGYRYEVLTDENDLYYVEAHFGPAGLNRPDIVHVYKSLTAKIVKADLLRYLVMYVEGGVYTDIDVEALRPIGRFIPDRFDEKDVDMVIGVEIDEPEWSDHPILGSKSESFCQWTFMAKPRLRLLMKLIDGIVDWLLETSRNQGVSIANIQLNFDEVLSGTGPSAFTKAVLADMSARSGQTVTWKAFHNLAESKLISGILVLIVEAFAAGQGHSDSGNHNARSALVKHHYHASLWPKSHPRFNHPMYGEIEECNWDESCIRAWDENVKTFDSLSEDEQIRQIATKEAREAAYKDILALQVQEERTINED
jgi:mannosyltransferase OCH1-like enzyme